jgi:hypothetical protein
MFGTVVEKVQALLSRSFLLGNFFPVLVVALLNVTIAWFGIDGFSDLAIANWPRDPIASSMMLGVILVTVAILAFIFAPLIPGFRSILEGAWFLPGKIRSNLIAHHRKQSDTLQKDYQDAVAKFGEFELLEKMRNKTLGMRAQIQLPTGQPQTQ